MRRNLFLTIILIVLVGLMSLSALHGQQTTSKFGQAVLREIEWTEERPDGADIGLSKPQPEVELPRRRVPVRKPVRKEKVPPKTLLKSVDDFSYIITGGWEMIEEINTNADGKKISSSAYDSKKWYNATVPGTVLTTLVDVGVYPDPYYGLNNLDIPDTLCRMNWWYRTSFKRPENSRKKSVYLLFNGINYEAVIWFNGTKLATIKGAFTRGQFEVSKYLKEDNHLAIQILPPPHPGIPHEQSALTGRGPNGGALCQDGPTFICSEGWDWMPGIRDRNIGLWQDVRLIIAEGARVVDPQVIVDLPLPDTSEAALTIKTTIDCEKPGAYTLNATIGDLTISKKLTLKKGKQQVVLSPEKDKNLILKNPKLWWPNGYGEQNLYTVSLILNNSDNHTVHQKNVRFGIRELSYEMAVWTDKKASQRFVFNPVKAHEKRETAIFNNRDLKPAIGQPNVALPALREGVDINQFELLDGNNPIIVIRVNGVPIFCKGGNWGMDDAMKRVSRERMEPYFKLHKDANYTMIRNWTGESTEEVFYDLADEYGMLIWNDFWMSTRRSNAVPLDYELFMDNVKETIIRFRNHPSIVIWCPRNEGFAPKGLEDRINNAVAKLDGTRHYHGNSRLLNMRASGPWRYIPDIKAYFNMASGFASEVGSQSFPTAESMLAMMDPEEAWPISDTWYYHDHHTYHMDYRAHLINEFGEPYSLDEFSKKAQLLNYESFRAIFEGWNSKMFDDCSGILLWMSHPAWPALIWQSYTWDYETHGSYFGAKKGCEPLHIQHNANNNKVIATNMSRNDYKNAKAVLTYRTINGKNLSTQEKTIDLLSNTKTECFKAKNTQERGIYFMQLKLTSKDGKLLSDNLYWFSNSKNRFYGFALMDSVKLEGQGEHTTTKGMTKGYVILKNTQKTIALSIKLNARHAETGERILPAYFEDGYFSIFPGEEKKVYFEIPEDKVPSSFMITAEGYNVKRQTIIKTER